MSGSSDLEHSPKTPSMAFNPIATARTVKRRISHQIAILLTRKWDKRHGVDTGGRVAINASRVAVVGNHAQSGYDIVSTPPNVFAYLTRYFPDHPNNYSYMDIGCGKGRTVLLASELGFKTCIGIDFASFACEIARKNLTSYKSAVAKRSPCAIFNECATKCAFPDGNLLLFFNNPFGADLWPEVTRRIAEAANQDRAVTIVLLGSFPDTIRAAADLLTQSQVISKHAEGMTPRFWDLYAPFHYIVLTNSRCRCSAK